jgi:hypothetical protein
MSWSGSAIREFLAKGRAPAPQLEAVRHKIEGITMTKARNTKQASPASKQPNQDTDSVLRQMLENNHQQTNTLLQWVGIAVTLIVFLAGGSLAFGAYTWLTVGDDVQGQIETVVPAQARIGVLTAVPEAVESAAKSEAAAYIDLLRPTIEADLATEVYIAVQTSVPPVAEAAVAEAERGKFSIIVFSDPSIQIALTHQDQLIRDGYQPKIYKIGEYYVSTLFDFLTEEEVQRSLLEVKAQVEPSAYFIDLSKACPYEKLFNPGYWGCSLVPWE